MLLAVEPLLLQDEGWDAIFEQRQAGVMRSRYDSEDTYSIGVMVVALAGKHS